MRTSRATGLDGPPGSPYKSGRMAAGKTRRNVRVRSVTRLSPSVKSIEFEAMDGQPVGHIAGQWVNLYVATPVEEVRRSYSIASMPPGPASQFISSVTNSALDVLCFEDELLPNSGPT